MATVVDIDLELTNKLAEVQGIYNNSRRLLASKANLGQSGVLSNQQLGKSGIEAAFLQGECAWEVFLENIVVALLCGEPTLSGKPDPGYLAPASEDIVRKMVLAGGAYCEWASPVEALKRVQLFFPPEHRVLTAISASSERLNHAGIVRNAIAHNSGSAQRKFHTLCTTLLGSRTTWERPADFLTAKNRYEDVDGPTMFESYIQIWQSLRGILVA